MPARITVPRQAAIFCKPRHQRDGTVRASRDDRVSFGGFEAGNYASQGGSFSQARFSAARSDRRTSRRSRTLGAWRQDSRDGSRRGRHTRDVPNGFPPWVADRSRARTREGESVEGEAFAAASWRLRRATRHASRHRCRRRSNGSLYVIAVRRPLPARRAAWPSRLRRRGAASPATPSSLTVLRDGSFTAAESFGNGSTLLGIAIA